VKKLLLAAVVGMVAVTAPLSAHADGTGYVGTCRISTVNDTTPGGVLGGQRVWNGQFNIEVAASTPGDQITAASCAIKVTASGSESTLPFTSASPLPAPAFVGAGQATFTADVTDTVYICTRVTTTAGGAEDHCVPLTTTPVCPEQVCGDGGVLGPNGLVDQILCPILKTLAPVVDSLPTSPDILWIDPSQGDVYVGGNGDTANIVYDCPPYVPAA
jgi:hypothetical protein